MLGIDSAQKKAKNKSQNIVTAREMEVSPKLNFVKKEKKNKPPIEDVPVRARKK